MARSTKRVQVEYRESVKSKSTTDSMACIATSPNNVNKIYIMVEPLVEALSMAIEKGDIRADDDFKIRACKLSDDYGWDVIRIPETASNTASDIITKRETVLQTAIKGQGSVQLVHDHWKPLEGDPLDPESQVRNLTVELRQEKGLPTEIPSVETYLDKA
ncbi:Elongation factor 2 [Orbilia oligospora]|nr:Elongation factor 2 [Orbilia oligospora]